MTRYGYPDTPAGRDERSSAGLFAMMRSRAAGIMGSEEQPREDRR